MKKGKVEMSDSKQIAPDMHELVERAWKEADRAGGDTEAALEVLRKHTDLGVAKAAQLLLEARPKERERWANAERKSLRAIRWANLELAAQGLIIDTGERKEGRICWSASRALLDMFAAKND